MRLFLVIVIVLAWLSLALGAIETDLVRDLPGFPPPEKRPFKSYSGFLTVQVPEGQEVSGYSGWHIHYQLELKQGPHSQDTPITAWHTGGPGGSSIYGLYGEAGYFQVSEEGTSINPYAWNRFLSISLSDHPHALNPTVPGGFRICYI